MKPTQIKPISLGEILRCEYMQPRKLTVGELSKALSVSRTTLSAIINDKRPLTAKQAVKLAEQLGTTAEFWMRIQIANQLWEARNGF
ncbi:HigA family addiction module antitoxin [Marinobacterium jannaschii]|uniref:HigA family addiction module antitoxin n=1 Tax=Marinobacterium jannaschii TaxID=64970 RepID=UPI000687A8D5|nr:HigA family addiction module antitoxin [Marinobacterium jannaschii]